MKFHMWHLLLVWCVVFLPLTFRMYYLHFRILMHLQRNYSDRLSVFHLRKFPLLAFQNPRMFFWIYYFFPFLFYEKLYFFWHRLGYNDEAFTALSSLDPELKKIKTHSEQASSVFLVLHYLLLPIVIALILYLTLNPSSK